MATKKNKSENKEVKLTPEQQNMQAHINSLTKKIQAHQFEIEELIPSLRTYEQTLANSLQNNANTNEEENENDGN
jgi:predicted RNase H-like nuclease (RuvC/YqgF family)